MLVPEVGPAVAVLVGNVLLSEFVTLEPKVGCAIDKSGHGSRVG